MYIPLLYALSGLIKSQYFHPGPQISAFLDSSDLDVSIPQFLFLLCKSQYDRLVFAPQLISFLLSSFPLNFFSKISVSQISISILRILILPFPDLILPFPRSDTSISQI